MILFMIIFQMKMRFGGENAKISHYVRNVCIHVII